MNMVLVGGLPLITYASRGGGGVNTDAYKCVQGGRGGLNMTNSTHFVRRFSKNATISETLKDRQHRSIADFGFIEISGDFMV